MRQDLILMRQAGRADSFVPEFPAPRAGDEGTSVIWELSRDI
jgi:hypothetical protein